MRSSMKPDAVRLGPLIEKVASAQEPSCELFAEVWFATTGDQPSDIKVRFALLMDARAWTDAALITAAHALPGWGVVARSGPGPGEARMQPPDARRHEGKARIAPVRHAGGAALAILHSMLQSKAVVG